MYYIHALTLFQVSHCISARVLQNTTLSEIIDTATEEHQLRGNTFRRLSVLSGIFKLWHH
jgi:hypothetical protein